MIKFGLAFVSLVALSVGADEFPNVADTVWSDAVQQHQVCNQRASEEAKWTYRAQQALRQVNNPADCTTAPLLLCDTSVHKFQGTGSRLFFLGRCLTEGLNAGRAVILTYGLPSSHDMLKPFEPWSNCTLNHAKVNTINARIMKYSPMDASSLAKEPAEAPGAGLLIPKQFASKGYWWWKAQEITYALRPKVTTLQALARHMKQVGWTDRVAVFQVRRTDKTEGCAKSYGKQSPIKCKAEAKAPKLKDFVDALLSFSQLRSPTKVAIITDDLFISREISEFVTDQRFSFLPTQPAPKRVVDKDKKGGVFKNRALKDALDILLMSFANPLIFTYSSGFGALALQLKQTRDNFCSNWASLDWGKREWPQVGAIGEGGARGVKFNSTHASKVCYVECNRCNQASRLKHACDVKLVRDISGRGVTIVRVKSTCRCKK